MEENMTLNQLVVGWEKLDSELKRSNKIDLDSFKKVFEQTYSRLSKCASEDVMNKDDVALVSRAYLFANNNNKLVDSRYLAALVLTERMLDSCAFSTTSELSDKATVYALEARREVEINFSNVTGSMNILQTALEKSYWDKIND